MEGESEQPTAICTTAATAIENLEALVSLGNFIPNICHGPIGFEWLFRSAGGLNSQ